MKDYIPNRFELIECSKEFNNVNEIKTGCTIADAEPRKLHSFKNKTDALNALKGFESLVLDFDTPSGKMFYVTEFVVESFEVDEDGEYNNGSDFDIADFSDYSKELLRSYRQKKGPDHE